MNIQQLFNFIDQKWEQSIIPVLHDYIRIPNKSPTFDPNWQSNGHMEKAVELMVDWCKQQNVANLEINVHRLPGKTPLLMLEIPGETKETILLYGHLDKQPEMTGWSEGLGPWQPVLKGDRLYGRGGADDGYALFAALTAIKGLQEQQIPHARCVILIEASEESGSRDLPAYVDHLAEKIGTPSLVICLDSGCGNYSQLLCTTSLRGSISGELKVEILTEGVHSGAASGIAPSSFRILRQLLTRLENENTGEMLLDDLKVAVPAERLEQAKSVAAALKDSIWQDLPFVPGARPMAADNLESILNKTWRPTLSLTGIDGVPSVENAGNVLRPYTTVKLSVRTPPTCDAKKAAAAIKKLLETNPPYNARVSFTLREQANSGWNAPPMQDWLKKSMNEASLDFFNKPVLYWGEGGTIPFMGMLGAKFPQAQFVITGVLGPHSNAHGPNEFLHIPMAKKLTGCVAKIVADHYQK